MDDDDILEAARTIRSFLPEIPGVDDPVALDAALAAALSQRDVPVVRARLRSAPALRRWVRDFARLGFPPELLAEQTRGADPPPGHGGVVAAPRFRCPEGDYVWYRRAAVTVPLCPSHGVRVVPDPVAAS